jgi:DNA-binding SARP family transcriptional activator
MVEGPIFFRILGQIGAERGGQPLELPGGKGKAIASLFLLRAGRVVSTDDIVDAVWWDPPTTVRKSIQVYVWKLRKLFEGDPGVRLETRDRGYVLRVDPERVDALRFETLVERASGALARGEPRAARDLLDGALALWRGEPLAGLDLAVAPEAEIAALHELRISARETRLEAELALGRHRDALPDLDGMLAEDPLGERLHGLVALAYYRSERQADALQVLERLKRSLSAELGLSPGPAIEELERRILQHDPGLDLPHGDEERSRSAREGRKTVTAAVVLFARSGVDPDTDPETRLEALTDVGEAAGAIVESYGGVVSERFGGRLSVLFGVPTLHEDDALRAAKAVAAIRDAISPSLGGPEGFSAGIAVGEVLIRRSGDEEVLLSADPVRIADQVAHAARPGEILLTRPAARLAGGAPLLEGAETLLLDTAGAPLLVYRLEDAGSLVDASARRLRSPLVGRSEELALLRQTFERVQREPTCSLVTVFGPAGVGKSRLASEFVEGLRGEALVLNGRCLSYGSDITFWPVAEMLRQAAGIVPSDAAEDVRPKIGALVQDVDESSFIVDRALSVLGLGAGSPDRDEFFWSIRRMFQALAAHRPTVLVVDDLHWAEPAMLELIEHVAAASTGTPVLLLCTSRPDLLERRPDWGGGRLDAANIALDALTEPESVEMITNLVRGAPLPGDVLERIVDVTAGHALYIEEYVATLIDEGMLVWNGTAWESALGPDEELPTPTSVQALLAARLDRLSDPARSLLEAASIAGKEFGLRDLRAVVADADDEALAEALDEALAKDMLIEDQRSAIADRRFEFRHLLIRDVAYHAMAKSARADGHVALAEHLEREAASRIVEVEEIVGYHLEAAYRYRIELGDAEGTDELARRAAGHLASSGWRAFLRDDMAAAAGLLSRSRALLSADDPRIPEIAWRSGVALFETGRLEEAQGVFDDGLRAAEALGATGLAWRIRLELAELDFWRLPEARSTLELEGLSDAAIAECTRLEDWGTVARAYRLKGDVLGRRGAQGAALVAYEEAQRHALLIGDEREANERANLGLVLGPLPVEVCIEHTRKRLADGRRASPEMHSQLGLALAMAGRPEESDAAFDRALTEARELGAEWKLASIVMYQAVGLLIRDLAAEAEAALEPAVGSLEAMGEKSMFSSAVALLAEARFRRGDLEGALEATLASERATAPDDLASQMAWRGVRAKVLAARGEVREAEELARSAVGFADRTDMLTFVGDAHVDLGLVLARAGKGEQAVAEVERAIGIFREKGNVASATRAQEILRRVRAPVATSGR